MINEKIIKIATKVRYVCERFACSDDAMDYDFWRNPDLGCMCAIASMTLAKVLRRFNYRANVINGKFRDRFAFNREIGFDHCWVEVGSNIIDITVTQFGINEPVYVCKIMDNPYYFKGIIKNDFEKFSNWPDTQKPNKHITQKLFDKCIMDLSPT